MVFYLFSDEAVIYQLDLVTPLMGGSRIFDWGGLRIEKARDDGQKMALYSFKSWPMGWGMEPPLSALLSCAYKVTF